MGYFLPATKSKSAADFKVKRLKMPIQLSIWRLKKGDKRQGLHLAAMVTEPFGLDQHAPLTF